METYEQQMKDSDIIFNVISSCAKNKDEADRMMLAYIMDMNFSRSGCSHAITRLEKLFEKETKNLERMDDGRDEI